MENLFNIIFSNKETGKYLYNLIFHQFFTQFSFSCQSLYFMSCGPAVLISYFGLQSSNAGYAKWNKFVLLTTL